MIKITNTYVLIDKEYLQNNFKDINEILSYLTYVDPQSLEKQPMYTVSDNLIKIPIGYLDYINSYLNQTEIIDERTKLAPQFVLEESSIKNILGKIENVLPNIVLRKDQVFSVYYAIKEKSGIFQLATGSGKTEIISAIIKYWKDELDYTPNIVILEPTVKLVNQTIDRLKKYGIESSEYSCDRNISGIKVTHPASIYNDVQTHPDHLSELHCIICDEGHHLSAITWRAILDNAKNLEIRLAFSASIIDQDKVEFTSLSQLDFDENLIVGITGKILINYPPYYYIEKGILATPVVFRMYNAADDKMKIKHSRNFYKYGVDYQAIKKYRVGSPQRIKLCALTVLNLLKSEEKLKVLILAETKDFAFQLLNEFNSLGIGNKCRTVFGGNESFKLNKATKEIEKEEEDAVNMLTSGEISVIIATSVMYEGADIPVLDVVVLYSVGVEQRVFIQGIGRVLRKGKTGKFAYIIDFTDHEDKILRKHSLKRRDMFLSIIGITEDHIFDGLLTQEISNRYLALEGRYSNNA